MVLFAARLRCTSAQAALGQIYEFGQGFPVDRKEAVAWYRQAAKHGDMESAGRLGTLLLLGHGADDNLEEAVKWLTMAAEKGNAVAQFSLTQLYASGWGVQRDLQKAGSLLILAGKTLDGSKQLNEISSQLDRKGSNAQRPPIATRR